METINILGINVNNLNKKSVLTKIEEFLSGKKQRQLITVNPEMILEATGHDEEFFYILNKADLSLPDGVGLKMAGWLMGVNLRRVTGADLIKDILELAEKQNRLVAVFNWQSGLSKAEDIERVLAEKYPKLQALAIDVERGVATPESALAQARDFSPDIIFSTLGAPYQEKFIFHNLANWPSVKIGMGVGGSFDFLTKKIKRAPKLFRSLGLEWLWRLSKQPGRWKRIYNAVIVFPYKFFLWRFILPFRYRNNVACLLYKKEPGGRYKILIVERADNQGHWQIPQGGTDRQTLAKAGRRELSEEINNNKFKDIAVFSKVNVYEFTGMMSKFLVPAERARGYKGQKQGLFIAEYTGADSEIKVNFWEHASWRWIEAEKLIEAVYPTRRPAAKIFMEKFWKVVNK